MQERLREQGVEKVFREDRDMEDEMEEDEDGEGLDGVEEALAQ